MLTVVFLPGLVPFRSDNRSFLLAFDTHDAASAREKSQGINVTLHTSWSCMVDNFPLNTGYAHGFVE